MTFPMMQDLIVRDSYDVRRILGILDFPPHPHFTQPISTVRPQNWAILEPPPPSVRTSYVYGPYGTMYVPETSE